MNSFDAVRAKPIWKSKTAWLNAAVLAATAVVEVSSVPVPGVDPKTMLMAVAVANLVLRVLTKKPVRLTSEPPHYR